MDRKDHISSIASQEPPSDATDAKTTMNTAPPAAEIHFAPDFAPCQRRSGFYVPLPLAITIALLVLFESSLLFMYTTIGLYRSMPAPAPFLPVPVVYAGPQMDLAAFSPSITHAAAAAVLADHSTAAMAIPVTTEVTKITEIVTMHTTEAELGPNTSYHSSPITNVETVTAPAPTITILSTASAPSPSMTTSVVFLTKVRARQAPKDGGYSVSPEGSDANMQTST